MGVKRRRRWIRIPKRQVKCVDCGFLAIKGSREVITTDRTLVIAQNAGLPGDLASFDCSLGLWDVDLLYSERTADLALDEATKQRHCRGYLKYRSGWSPEGHRTLQMRSEDRRSDRITNVIFLLLGAALALLTQWVAKLLGLG